MNYCFTDWMMFFFFYCIIGWIWESGYVSLRTRTWVNRGFLYGPWLPIYGFGALTVLLATLPVRMYLSLVFVTGMISATILEYVTGAAMEKLFHMRYWDYSDKPMNIRGHICLPVSLAWGCFSVLMILLIHPPVERLILSVPDSILAGIVSVLAVLFAFDTAKSVHTALSLKDLLVTITKNSQTLNNIEARMDQIIEQINSSSEGFRRQLAELEEAIAQKQEQLHQGLKLERKIDIVMKAIEAQRLGALTDQEQEHFARLHHNLQNFNETVKNIRAENARRKKAIYQKAVSMFRRNPSAASPRHRHAFAELKELRKQWKQNRQEERTASAKK